MHAQTVINKNKIMNENCALLPENKCVDACTLDGKINNKWILYPSYRK